ncbi:hypothetical protein R1flu_002249 [Riccia fluitans]|uniref:CCHC-type domain-containing protein n=1 Tax=Riccia fluitans TaxID=41844 RepID=A0ABD1Y6K6_9MARC
MKIRFRFSLQRMCRNPRHRCQVPPRCYTAHEAAAEDEEASRSGRAQPPKEPGHVSGKDEVRSHQEWENCEEQPPKKQAESESRGAPSRRRGPTEYRGTQPTTGKRPKIDPARGQNLECYGCGERGHPVHPCSENHSKQKVAQILKERKAAYNKPKEKKDYFLVCRLSRSEVSSMRRIMAKINEGSFVLAVLDSGAMEVCPIPKRIAKDAIRSGTEIEPLDPPVRLRLGDNETEVVATEAITAVIRLKTKVGELITRKHRCLIWEVPSDEIILGGDFLKQLGIDPEKEFIIEDNLRRLKNFCDATGRPQKNPTFEASLTPS